jgi:hypothetical protein
MKSFIMGIKDHGLQNHLLPNVMDVGGRKSDIKVESLCPAKVESYTNSVEWTLSAVNSSSILYNENHQFTYMCEHLDMRETYLHYKQTKEGISKTVSAVMEQGHREVIVKFLDIKELISNCRYG